MRSMQPGQGEWHLGISVADRVLAIYADIFGSVAPLFNKVGLAGVERDDLPLADLARITSRAINELAATGAAIVMVSSDLPELLGMADRILVMRRGRMVAERDAKTTTQEEIVKQAALDE